MGRPVGNVVRVNPRPAGPARSGAEEHGREMRSVALGEAGRHDNIVAVARDHHELALGEHAEAARDALANTATSLIRLD